MNRPDPRFGGSDSPSGRLALRPPLFFRRPVSVLRQRIGITLFLLLALSFALYRFETSDGRIRTRAVQFLRAITGGEVEVAAARFTLFGGIDLRDVRIAAPQSAGFPGSADSREIFAADSLSLLHDPWALLGSRLRVREIIATRPRLTIAQDVETGRYNWQALSVPTLAEGRAGRPPRPLAKLRDAEVALVSLDAAGKRRTERLHFDVDVRPHPANRTGYLIDVRQYDQRPGRGRILYDPIAGAIADVPLVGLGTIQGMLPKVYQQFFERIGLRGDVRSERIQFGSRAYNLQLRGVSLALPLSLLGQPAAQIAPGAAEPMLHQLTDIYGELNLVGDELSGDLRGSLDGAPITLRGRISQIERPLHEIGLDVELACDAIPLPPPELRRLIHAGREFPDALTSFLHVYDPSGLIGVTCRLVRPPGGEPLRFLGSLRPIGTSARYIGFPVRLDDVRGEVRFAEDGVYIDNLIGRHGSATARIHGRLDHPVWWTGLELSVDAEAVPLDESLYRALNPRYQRMWRHFDPRGFARISAHMARDDGDRATGSKPWHQRLDVALTDAAIRFAGFPYPFANVHGNLHIGSGRIELDGITAELPPATGPTSQPGGSVRVDGVWIDSNSGTTDDPVGRLELRVDARALPIDQRLADALPADARGALAQFNAAGHADLVGRVFTRTGDPDVRFDLDARLSEASLRHVDLPFTIERLGGRLRITPDRITLIDLAGRHGPTAIDARGEVQQAPDGYRVDLRLALRDLRLDDDLRAALPERAAALWRLLEPRGSVDLTTQYRRVVAGPRVEQRHRSEVLIHDAALRYAHLPLPLEGVSGRATVSDRRIELADFRARCGTAELRAGGSIDIADAGPSGLLKLELDHLLLDRAFADALPPSLRAGWQSLQPAGRCDVRLDILRFAPAPGGMTWNWRGSANFPEISARIGLDLRATQGAVQGEGALSPAGTAFDLSARLAQARLGPFDFRDLVFRSSFDPVSRRLRIRDCEARLFGGAATGECAIEIASTHTDYAFSMNVADAQLRDLLDAMRQPGQPPTSARGLLFGKFAIRGRVGDDAGRRGGGEVFLREAQVWRLPAVLEIFRLINLAPDENMFHDGWVKFSLDGHTLHFDKIDLQGHSVSLVGRGTLDTRDESLNVTLLVGSPLRLRVPVLTELVEGASRDLFEVQVTGNIRNPRTESRPFNKLRRELEALFQPGGR